MLITAKQLAARLNMHHVTVLRLAREGRLPFTKTSKSKFGHKRFDYEKVLKYLERNNRSDFFTRLQRSKL